MHYVLFSYFLSSADIFSNHLFTKQIFQEYIWPRGYETFFHFFMLNSIEHKISTAHKIKIPTNEEDSCFKSLRSYTHYANNVKMPTIGGILTFMSRLKFWVS